MAGKVRLMKELKLLQKTPVDFIEAKPHESDIFTWYYLLTGPPDTPYEGGKYLGKLQFPPEYPMKAPEISMITPNGRFKTCFPLCLSMSNYHQETWNPSWSVANILVGLLSFMTGSEITTGSIEPPSSDDEKRKLAAESMAFNETHPVFRKLFKEELDRAAVSPGLRSTVEAPPDAGGAVFRQRLVAEAGSKPKEGKVRLKESPGQDAAANSQRRGGVGRPQRPPPAASKRIVRIFVVAALVFLILLTFVKPVSSR